MSDRCNKLLTTVIVSPSQSQGSGSGVGTIPSMSGEARGALHTFVCKRLTVPARCRAKAGRFRPQKHARMVPSWPPEEAVVVRAEGIEPSRPCGLRIFLPLRLSPPRQRRVRGLDYPFTIPH